jgi:hypothetical protein
MYGYRTSTFAGWAQAWRMLQVPEAGPSEAYRGNQRSSCSVGDVIQILQDGWSASQVHRSSNGSACVPRWMQQVRQTHLTTACSNLSAELTFADQSAQRVTSADRLE